MHYTPGCAVPAATIHTPSRFSAQYDVQSRQNLDACLASAARAKAQDYARENLRLDFADAEHWRALAAAAGFNLPAWYVTSTGGKTQGFADRLGLTIHEVYAATGCRSFRSFVEMNPTWPLFAHVGVLLEIAAELAAERTAAITH
ncbi:hypothetical protein [Pseudomonas syringae]|uniref:8-oxo-dGTP pyrophosphatase MutT and related house-cleaning NTP pyrophosphohydrolase n=1 Tax=Pseudomonas syringae pv. actinidiae TaxID=103796 RepID=A0A2V0QLE6_PSESF|nr:hypothetical protein [Pseudomonas syringae]AQL38239.1 hypothetical protein JN853_18535 [Pseudomonas syringae pv. actinidiae ICMP 9853]EGH68702.1 hypothetical protein PSYAC_28218 [Pseudomonas syringae pv. actinidiae str. M302091]EPM52727.1 hypothetical protein A256_13446 [Pseudomonas syringae pv. actinidiae ICMP 19103]EPM87467.1 hypothetical protein A260_13111 [Pseudomonas syringae pv. actinidiae ICMP 19068]EPM96281.1 hypothetical protein A258_13701 [Pseudomonas syringae pv. actinidiae ICMP 